MNLIIGSYDYEKYREVTQKGGILYFLKSIRMVNKDCTIVIICSNKNANKALQDICDKYNAVLYKYDRGDKSQMYYRFVAYNNYLNSNPDIKNILLSDVNDVIFLDDPFSIKFNDCIYTQAERHTFLGNSNRHSELNLKWITDICQKENNVFKNEYFHNKTVVCAGHILGDRANIMIYLNWYLELQGKHDYSLNDQAMYNIYIHTVCDKYVIDPWCINRLFPDDTISFDILTNNWKSLSYDANGFLVNNNGEKIVSVHMYGAFGSGKQSCDVIYLKKLIDDNYKEC